MNTFIRNALFTAVLGFAETLSFAQANVSLMPIDANVQHQAQNYMDANFGLAYIGAGVALPFPGASFLFGRRSFQSTTMFLDAELGLAAPTVATCKLGIGHLNPATGMSFSTGIRPFPSHVYVQLGKEDGRCGDNVKPRIARRLKRRGKDPTDIMCGESLISFELSAWLLENRLQFQRLIYGRTSRNETLTISAWSALMITWGHRWYFN